MDKILNLVLVGVIAVGLFAMVSNDPKFAKEFGLRQILKSMGILSFEKNERAVRASSETKSKISERMEYYRQLLADQRKIVEDARDKQERLMADLQEKMERGRSNTLAGSGSSSSREQQSRIRQKIQEAREKNVQMMQRLAEQIETFQTQLDEKNSATSEAADVIAEQQRQLMEKTQAGIADSMEALRQKLDSIRELQKDSPELSNAAESQQQLVEENRRKNEELMQGLQQKMVESRERVNDLSRRDFFDNKQQELSQKVEEQRERIQDQAQRLEEQQQAQRDRYQNQRATSDFSSFSSHSSRNY